MYSSSFPVDDVLVQAPSEYKNNASLYISLYLIYNSVVTDIYMWKF